MLNLLNATEIIAQRVFSPVYIIFDSIFLVFFMGMLIVKKRYLTALFALFGGVLYMVVDYGIFHLALHTRNIENGNLFWVLLWMSMSYGITNFALIWIWLNKDEHYVEFTAAVFVWWICCPMLAATFGGGLEPIKIQRTTGSYHGYMAGIMVLSYFSLIVYNVLQKEPKKRFHICWLFLLGVLAQLGWEAGLLIGGIRSAEFDPFTKLMTLVTNSLVETNLGLPLIYCIYLFITARFTENGKKREPVKFLDRLSESNITRYPKFAKGKGDAGDQSDAR